MNNFSLQTLTPFIYTFPIIALLLGGYISFINRKLFLDLLRPINKKYFIVLLAIITLFVILCSFQGLNFKFFNECDAEWKELCVARNFLLGDTHAFNQLYDRVTSPLLLALGFRIFGFNPLVASILNLVLGTLSIVLIFILAQLIFNNAKVSLISALIYAFHPYMLIYTSVRMGNPTTVGFFMLLFVISAILAFKYHRFSLHISTIVFFALASQVKLEYFVLIFPYFICFLLFKEYRYFSFRKIIIWIALFFILSAPFFIGNMIFRLTTVSGWCGYPSQTFHNGEIYSYTIPFLVPLDKALKFLANERFSFSYMFYDMPNFMNFWFAKKMGLLSLIIISGFVLSLKKHRKEGIFLLLTFCFISTVYLADCIYYTERLAFSSYNLVIIYSGLFIVLFSRFIAKIIKSRLIIESALEIILVLVLLVSWYFNLSLLTHNHFRNNHNHLFLSFWDFAGFQVADPYNDLKSIMTRYTILPENSNLITSYHGEQDVLRFMGYQAICITDLVGYDYFKDRDEFFRSFTLPLSLVKNNYFIEREELKETKNVCDFVIEKYVKRKIGKMGIYNIYLLNNSNNQNHDKNNLNNNNN